MFYVSQFFIALLFACKFTTHTPPPPHSPPQPTRNNRIQLSFQYLFLPHNSIQQKLGLPCTSSGTQTTDHFTRFPWCQTEVAGFWLKDQTILLTPLQMDPKGLEWWLGGQIPPVPWQQGQPLWASTRKRLKHVSREMRDQTHMVHVLYCARLNFDYLLHFLLCTVYIWFLLQCMESIAAGQGSEVHSSTVFQ